MTDDAIQNTSNANPVPLNNGLGLSGGNSPSLIPLNIDMSVAQSVLVDLTQVTSQGRIGPIQTIYVNNSGNSQPVTIVTPIVDQSYMIPAGDSAILPLFLPNQAPKFTVNSTGGVIIPIAVFNIPLPAQVWGGSFGGGSFTTIGGKTGLDTYDVGLNPLIVNLGGDGEGLGVYDLALNPLITDKGAGLALDVNVLEGGGASVQTSQQIIEGVLTSGVGFIDSANPNPKAWLITSIRMTFSPDITFAAAGANTFFLANPGGGQILAKYGFTGPAVAGVGVVDIPILDDNFSSPLSNGVHDVVRAGQFTNAITAGRAYLNISAYEG